VQQHKILDLITISLPPDLLLGGSCALWPSAGPRRSPAPPPVVPPGWGEACWNWPPTSSSRIYYPITPARNPTHPSMPACLDEVISYFAQHDIVPDHMSSGLDYADGLPHLVFSVIEMPVDNCTACVMVATSAFSPLSILSQLAKPPR
jgi:hypothetical protein